MCPHMVPCLPNYFMPHPLGRVHNPCLPHLEYGIAPKGPTQTLLQGRTVSKWNLQPILEHHCRRPRFEAWSLWEEAGWGYREGSVSEVTRCLSGWFRRHVYPEIRNFRNFRKLRTVVDLRQAPFSFQITFDTFYTIHLIQGHPIPSQGYNHAGHRSPLLHSPGSKGRRSAPPGKCPPCPPRSAPPGNAVTQWVRTANGTSGCSAAVS